MTEQHVGRFEWPVRVYWEDTDAGGVVYYANYLGFMERSRTEWLRALGIDQSRMREQTGALLVVRSAHCEFLRSARLDDELIVTVEVTKIGHASMVLTQAVYRKDGELLMTAEIKAGCLDGENWSPRRFPPALAEAMAKSIAS
jgi:acyl-CoA thioester hydrolase